MNISSLIRTLYLGDRACKAIVIDGWGSTVRVQVDTISRVRSASGMWEYYTAEDIEGGYLVFTGVESCALINDGHVPNDTINRIDVIEQRGEMSTVEMSIDSVASDASHHETFLRINCKSLHLEDPGRPGMEITD